MANGAITHTDYSSIPPTLPKKLTLACIFERSTYQLVVYVLIRPCIQRGDVHAGSVRPKSSVPPQLHVRCSAHVVAECTLPSRHVSQRPHATTQLSDSSKSMSTIKIQIQVRMVRTGKRRC